MRVQQTGEFVTELPADLLQAQGRRGKRARPDERPSGPLRSVSADLLQQDVIQAASAGSTRRSQAPRASQPDHAVTLRPAAATRPAAQLGLPRATVDVGRQQQQQPLQSARASHASSPFRASAAASWAPAKAASCWDAFAVDDACLPRAHGRGPPDARAGVTGKWQPAERCAEQQDFALSLAADDLL